MASFCVSEKSQRDVVTSVKLDGLNEISPFFLQAYNSEAKEFEEPPMEARSAAMKGKVSASNEKKFRLNIF